MNGWMDATYTIAAIQSHYCNLILCMICMCVRVRDAPFFFLFFSLFFLCFFLT